MSSVAYLSLLEDSSALSADPNVQSLALIKLNEIVDLEWLQISQSIELIKKLTTAKGDDQKRASLLASKVFFHLGKYDDALNYALSAQELFPIEKSDDIFVDKIIEQCIDNYVRLRQLSTDSNLESTKEEKELEPVVNRMFQRCFDAKKYQQALGIAIEARRIDIVQKAVSFDPEKMLQYAVDVADNLIVNREFRNRVFEMLALEFGKSHKNSTQDFFNQAECFLNLDKPEEVFEIIDGLLKTGGDALLVAYQIAFNLQDRAPQHFIKHIISKFRPNVPKVQSLVDQDENIADDTQTESKEISNLINILDGTIPIQYHIDFLNRRNKSDIQILENIKSSFDKNSICHNATVIANSYMYAGTSVDTFLRDNLQWLGQASNWSKFSATASLGVIHKGNFKNSRKLLEPYLPKDNNPGSTSVYSEGGALYALGLIHYNHPHGITEYLGNWVKQDNLDPTIQHGACLGLGLTAMASEDQSLFEKLSTILYLDNAVSSEAAAIAMGSVMLGSGNEDAIDEMLTYAGETPHEKIIRGIAIGLSLIMYGQEEAADKSIELLLSKEDPTIRYGAMYMIGMAYCGTGNNAAVRKLLKLAVSDVSDDVRRAAIINLGFVLFKTPKQVPRLLTLLAKSYNAHVRYGVALALGIACAGTGLKDAIDILETLADDDSDFVQQGAYLGLSMVLLQHNEKSFDENGERVGEKVKETRERFEKIYKGRNLVMKKMGAILGTGILDAGGRNVTICLHKSGHNKMRNCVGLMLFTQYWFWYPYLHYLSLAFEPTAFIGLNKDLQMPQFQFKSNAPPSRFAYPQKIKKEEKEKKKIGPARELSVSKRSKRDAVRSKEHSSGVKSPLTPFTPKTPWIETPLPTTLRKKDPSKPEKEDPMEIDEEIEEEIKKEKEPDFEILENPARIMIPQVSLLSFDVQSNYELVYKAPEVGFKLLNYTGMEDEVIVEMKDANKLDDSSEMDPPADFPWP